MFGLPFVLLFAATPLLSSADPRRKSDPDSNGIDTAQVAHASKFWTDVQLGISKVQKQYDPAKKADRLGWLLMSIEADASTLPEIRFLKLTQHLNVDFPIIYTIEKSMETKEWLSPSMPAPAERADLQYYRSIKPIDVTWARQKNTDFAFAKKKIDETVSAPRNWSTARLYHPRTFDVLRLNGSAIYNFTDSARRSVYISLDCVKSTIYEP